MNASVNNICKQCTQDPGVAYSFEGGTTFEFTTAPEANDDIAVFFYKGTASEDVAEINVIETIKNGIMLNYRQMMILVFLQIKIHED